MPQLHSPPFNVFTADVLEATASCLLAQAEEGEFENLNDESIEGLILEQFGECMSQILSLAGSGAEYVLFCSTKPNRLIP